MDSNAEDTEWINQILSGEPSRFSLLVERYERAIFAMSFSMLGNRQDAEDVTQEVFFTAYNKLRSFEGRSSLLTWLRRITHNLAIDLRRRKQSRGGNMQQVETDPIASTVIDPVDPLIADEDIARVRRSIDALPEEYRSLVVMRDIEDLDYAQIASILEIPIGTVRSRLHRARLELKEILERHGLGEKAIEVDSGREDR
jgi:RNA polymerase sigma-70 factor (ECF subfamily)